MLLETYCRVRQFPPLIDGTAREWFPTVHRTPVPQGVRFRVCLHGPALTILVCHFDVHIGRYGGVRDEINVALSAVGHAVQVALRLATIQQRWGSVIPLHFRTMIDSHHQELAETGAVPQSVL